MSSDNETVELIDRLQFLKRQSASIYGPLIDEACAALNHPQWIRVPREPTEAMCHAAANVDLDDGTGWSALDLSDARLVWSAMLSASPFTEKD